MDPAAIVKTLAALVRADAECASVLNRVHERDWPALTRAAAAHRVAPLLFSRLSAARALELAPGPERVFLEREARGTGAMNALLLNEHARVVRAAAEMDAPLLALKGAHLVSAGVYRADERPMTDLDYAIRASHAARACDALSKLGYELDAAGPGDEFTRKYAREFLLKRTVAQTPVAVELHDALIPSLALRAAFPLSADRLHDHAHEDASGFPVPCPEHALLFCILHFAVTHRFSRLIWLVDIDRMCRGFAIDWDAFERETRLARAESAVHAALRAARALLGTDAPDVRFAVRGALPGRVIDRRAALWLAGAAPAAEISALPFALCRRPARALLRHVFPPADFIALRYGVPAVAAPAWAAARPLLLAARALRASHYKK